jgi:phosphomannomutase
MDLFGTAGVRGPVADDVTPELALSVGRAVAADAVEESGTGRPTVVVGRDGRTTGSGLADAVAAGLAAGGADVRRAGVVPTPTLAFAARGRRGVMLTASHNPPADNGIKLFADGVEYDRAAERRVEERVADAADAGPLAAGPAAAGWADWGASEGVDPLPAYRDAVADYARGRVDAGPEPLAGRSVCVDCGTGVASLATPAVLAALGADVTALNASVDGHFPARESKPTAESLTGQRAFLARTDHDLGLAHDGDADRLVVLDGDGDVVHEDTVVAVTAEHAVRASDAADPVVVTTPNASGRVDERVDAAGGRVARGRLGALHEGIADARAAGGDVVYAAEPWKHVHPALGGWIDGVATAALVAVLAADAGGIDTLTDPVTERPYRKVSVDCPDDRKTAAMERIRERLPETVEGAVDTDHGVRIDRPDGSWVLVRPSGTEPYVRIYAEADDVDALVGTAREVVEAAVEG